MNWYKSAKVIIDPKTGKEVVVDDNAIDTEIEKQWGNRPRSGGGSILTLDYDHKNKGKNQNLHGNAGGTATFYDISKSKNKDIHHEGIDYREMYNTVETPNHWEQMTPIEKAKWLITMVKSGVVTYPGGVHDELLSLVMHMKHIYDPILAHCVTFTGKLPDFIKPWLTEKKLNFFPQTKAAIMKQREKMPPEYQTLDRQFVA